MPVGVESALFSRVRKASRLEGSAARTAAIGIGAGFLAGDDGPVGRAAPEGSAAIGVVPASRAEGEALSAIIAGLR